jgi:hypothetical protein
MFNVTLPDNPTHKDFEEAKAKLVSQAATKAMKAQPKATYAFGQKIGQTTWEVSRAFKQALRALNEFALIATGKEIATEQDMTD